ncbi:Vinculin, partial [Trichinella pseudospiralis]
LISSSIMPVFHTKTIESILEPVAQQSSSSSSSSGSRVLLTDDVVKIVAFASRLRKQRVEDGRAFRHVFFGIQTCRKLADAPLYTFMKRRNIIRRTCYHYSHHVSRLVILHEEAEDGNAMPDLTRPVDAVSRAVENLVQVGYDTIHLSDDDILKQDMPPALQRVETSSRLLEEACYVLRDDPYSSQGRKKLIEGSRGILQGTSALLLCFDESEVRKIVRGCKKVLDYLAVAEVIENMEDLVQFVRDISPWLTKMSRDTEAREKELTHHVHREILIRCIDSVKTLAPILICAMKIFIQISAQGGSKGVPEAAENRNYLSSRMIEEVNEVIRVLQLTTYDEDEWNEDDLIVMKKALSAIESLLQAALDWLGDPRALRGGVGEKSLRRILVYAERIADRALPEDASLIRRACSDIASMTDSLCELRHNKQGDSPQSQGLARGIAQKLRELVGGKDIAGLLPHALQGLEQAGIAQPAHTVLGRMDQVLKWLDAPYMDDRGVENYPQSFNTGLNALKALLAEGRKVADLCSPREKYAMNELCDEIERLSHQLAELQRKGMQKCKAYLQRFLADPGFERFGCFVMAFEKRRLVSSSDRADWAFARPLARRPAPDTCVQPSQSRRWSIKSVGEASAGRPYSVGVAKRTQTPNVQAGSIPRSSTMPLAAEPFQSLNLLLQRLVTELWRNKRTCAFQTVTTTAAATSTSTSTSTASARPRPVPHFHVCKAFLYNPYQGAAIGQAESSSSPPPPSRRVFFETESLLAPLVVRIGDSPQARAIANQLKEKLGELKRMMDRALLDRVVDDFSDITTPLKQFAEAVLAPEGTPARDANFAEKAQNLRDHCQRCAKTGRLVGTSGPCKDKKIVEALCSTANQISNMTPQVINAGKIRFHYPQNVSADEHFENLRRELSDALQRLRSLVDDAVDPLEFVKASENAIRRHGQECENAISNDEPQKMADHASSIARLANRVLMAAKGQAENSEDPAFSGRMNDAANRLQGTIPPMVNDAKQVALNPRDQSAAGRWRDSNKKLVDAVGSVRRALEPSQLPEMKNLDINGKTVGTKGGAKSSSRVCKVSSPLSVDVGYESDTAAPVSWSRPMRSKDVVDFDYPNIDFHSMFDMWLYQMPPVNLSSLYDLRRLPTLFHRRSASPRRRRRNRHRRCLTLSFPVDWEREQRTGRRREVRAPPPPPAWYQAASHREGPVSPNRPPPQLMEMRTPPRPPPPQETDDEEEMRAFWERVPLPKANQPILSAAHSLHREVQQWSSRENEIVAAAKRMAILMARLSQLVRGEGGTKKDLIDCAKAIADASEEVTRLAVLLARQCTDIKMRKALLQVCERIPTIATQLKILSTVKATMLGSQAPMSVREGSEISPGTDEDEEAMQQLVLNAQNLMQSVKDTVRAAEAASIKIRTDSGLRLRWVRKPVWANY